MSGAAPASIVELEGLTKRYGTFAALDDLSLAIAAGEFLTVLGASGSGKTTTLRLIAGFDAPTAGRILLEGRDVVALPPYKRPINTVFQHYALFPHMTVRGNVAYGLRRRHVPEREIAARVAEALAMVRLEDLGERSPRQLSGGQQQRVALARAIVNRPRLLLLDEPLGALDLKLRREMQLELKRLQTQLGITFVYVTHDQEEALTMSDRIALMRAGRIEQLGSPQDLYDRPASRYVADFIGETNLLPLGQGQWLSVRPDDLYVLASGTADPAAPHRTLVGTAAAVVYAGAIRKLHVTLADGAPVVVHQAAGSVPVAVADTIRLTWSPERGVVVRD